MILLYSFFFAMGVSAFFLLGRLGLCKRLIVSFLIFFILCIIATAALYLIGDRRPDGARPVTVEELRRGGDDMQK
jgi:hypothetical protein